MRMCLGTLAISIFSSSLVAALAIVVLVAGNAAHIADDKIDQNSPASVSQKAQLDAYTAEMDK